METKVVERPAAVQSLTGLDKQLTDAGVDIAAAKAALAKLDGDFGGEVGDIPDGALNDWANAHFDHAKVRAFLMSLGRAWEKEHLAKLPEDRKWERGPKAAEAKAKKNAEEWAKRHDGRRQIPAPQDFEAAAKLTADRDRIRAEGALSGKGALPGSQATSKAEAERKTAAAGLQDSTENVGGVGPLSPRARPDESASDVTKREAPTSSEPHEVPKRVIK